MSLRAAAVTGALTAATALLVAAPAAAAPVPQPEPRPQAPAQAVTAEATAAAGRAAAAPDTIATLSRFFAREGRVAASAAAPRIEGEAVPVHYLSPEFVAGRAGAPVARLEFLASRAVSADGQQAALWTAKTGGGWQVVNIATGDDEFRYARLGAERLPGGTVFREPQIDAWWVAGGERVLPLDEDAVRAVGGGGTTLAAYRARVARAYADKLPGSAYARSGKAGGYTAPPPPPSSTPAVAATTTATAAAALATAALTLTVHRRRRT
ncbi:hypothetical protein [Streptomyces sp. NPDC012888]|uniref:hypothetical protein n=1 Tax=Streptomyces sp. NPDC012888 TaxID=3364855 RepID=UPI00369DEC10